MTDIDGMIADMYRSTLLLFVITDFKGYRSIR